MTYGMLLGVAPIKAAYSEDKATQIRRDLRSMTRAEVARKWFPDVKQPWQSLLRFCKKNSIPLPAHLPSQYLRRKDDPGGSGKSSKVRGAIA